MPARKSPKSNIITVKDEIAPAELAPELVLAKQDKKLAALIDIVGECKLRHEELQDPFESLARAIVYQQLSGKAAGTIHSRVVALFGDEGKIVPAKLLKIPDEKLRGAGLSQNKMLALQDLSLKTLEGVVPKLEDMHNMLDQELIDRLTAVRGVGQWTVEMLMIFRLRRLDILPTTDLGVRKGVAITYGLKDMPPPKEVERIGEKWRPYRSIASWYLWRANEIPPGILRVRKTRGD